MYCTKLYCLLTLKNVSLPVTKSIFVSSLLKWKEISNYKISVTEFFFFLRERKWRKLLLELASKHETAVQFLFVVSKRFFPQENIKNWTLNIHEDNEVRWNIDNWSSFSLLTRFLRPQFWGKKWGFTEKGVLLKTRNGSWVNS